jgi:hypothetical protein
VGLGIEIVGRLVAILIVSFSIMSAVIDLIDEVYLIQPSSLIKKLEIDSLKQRNTEDMFVLEATRSFRFYSLVVGLRYFEIGVAKGHES